MSKLVARLVHLDKNSTWTFQKLKKEEKKMAGYCIWGGSSQSETSSTGSIVYEIQSTTTAVPLSLGTETGIFIKF